MGWILLLISVIGINIDIWFHYKKGPKSKKRRLFQIVHGVLTVLSFLYFCFFFTRQTDHFLVSILSYIAGIYIIVLLYASLFFFVIDIYHWIKKKRKKKSATDIEKRQGIVFLLALIIAIYGCIHGNTISIKQYQITLPKKESTLTSLRIVALADMHLGTNIKTSKLEKIKKQIEKLNPDIVFLLGDIVDEGTPDPMKKELLEIFKDLHIPKGIYYIIGNHELYRGNITEETDQFKDANITILTDKAVKIDDQFYVIGRKDKKDQRQKLSYLTTTLDNLPTIVLDHRPNDRESQNQNVDLQLSAHTHNGQIFPFHPFDFLTRQKTYGKYQQKSLTTIVTSGIGTWGIPLRIGSQNEIVSIQITFQKET